MSQIEAIRDTYPALSGCRKAQALSAAIVIAA
ncbi:hypothetical protein JOD49_003222 [Oerskovia jenensis]|uniref:Uncharacterized protein n=1 Tax=Oerskovia jenensis TaxID=162169 RepID=A0ABS2LJ60_9CELL|nr:hypothetical protein [Oerskovia jenensis]